MQEYFLIGLLCLVNPLTGLDQCAYINENPIKLYDLQNCKNQSMSKTKEIVVEMTEKGFFVSYINIECYVDKSKKKT
tara:strand:+ start:105 stop:335 length:231 start_codon:yes stop_codon:yes gene_type:complete